MPECISLSPFQGFALSFSRYYAVIFRVFLLLFCFVCLFVCLFFCLFVCLFVVGVVVVFGGLFVCLFWGERYVASTSSRVIEIFVFIHLVFHSFVLFAPF